MLTFLLGPDDFSKREYVDQLAKKNGAELAFFVQPEALPIDQMGGQDLFGSKKIFVLLGAVKLLDETNLKILVESPNQIIFLEEKIDKRSTFNKSLFANKHITIKDFALPHGGQLNKWIEERVKTLGGLTERDAVDALAVAVGRDEGKQIKFGGKVVEVTEAFTLQQVDTEIQKLLAYAQNNPVTREMVQSLVPESKEADVLEITNAIGSNDKQRTLELLDLFLSQETASDEKGKIIQLNALLSEQFRNVAVVQDFTIRRIPEQEILEKTGWKSGRLFVMKKIASHFAHAKVLDVLNKLSLLDEELKTTSTPPRVLLDLITVQLFE